jgi:hypothetical protein
LASADLDVKEAVRGLVGVGSSSRHVVQGQQRTGNDIQTPENGYPALEGKKRNMDTGEGRREKKDYKNGK